MHVTEQITPVMQPTEAELADAIARVNQDRTAGVYSSNPENLEGGPNLERLELHVGSLATGKAVGMASLPEQYAEQQLNRFDFSAEEYATMSAYEAEEAARIAAEMQKADAANNASSLPSFKKKTDKKRKKHSLLASV